MTDHAGPLTPAETAAALGAAGAAIEAELRGLPPAVLAWHPGPGEWCLLETLGHLIEAETRDIRCEDNQIEGFAVPIKDLRNG